jgi:hypothetical protein
MRDSDVRGALIAKELRRQIENENTRVVPELPVCLGDVRIDIAVINGSLVGYEIKSASDTLRRLPIQAEYYSRVFDRVVLVVDERHLQKARGLVPAWWRLISVRAGRNGQPVLSSVRRGKSNPSVDPLALAQLLWKNEAMAVLERHGLDRGVRTKPVRFLWARLSSELCVEALRREVLSALKARHVAREFLASMSNKALELIDDECNVMVRSDLTPCRVVTDCD